MIAIEGNASIEMKIGDDLSIDPLSSASIFYIIESTNMFVPAGRIKLVDTNGLMLMNIDKLVSQPIIFQVGLPGKSGVEDILAHNHRFFSMKNSGPTRSIRTVPLNVDIFTWSRIGEILMGSDKIRSFGSKSASAVAQDVCTAEGLSTRIIETSVDKRSYIQSQWTTAQFLKHLAKHALSSNGSMNFLYFIDREEKLTFASPKYLFDQGIADAIVLTYSSNPKTIEDNPNTTILEWIIGSRSKFLMLRHGRQRVFKYFDPTNFSFSETTISVDSEIPDLSDSTFALLATDDSDNSRSINVGAKSSEDDFGVDGSILNSLIDMRVMIRYNEDIKLGGIVKVMIPIPTDLDNDQAEVVYDSMSSYWMVSKITHYVSPNSKAFVMILELTRSGINQKDAIGLVETSA